MLVEPIELIAKARAGQADALGELCTLYRNYLRRVVRSGMGARLKEKIELSDVVQETLVEVIKQFPQFNGETETALLGWMRRLVCQKLADLGRYHSRAKRAGGVTPLSLDMPDDADFEPASRQGRLMDLLSLSQTSPSEAASRRELTVLLADALTKLPEDEADVLWLYHADGLSFESIGEQLGTTRKVARGIWARGLKSLKRVLDEPPGGHWKWEEPSS